MSTKVGALRVFIIDGDHAFVKAFAERFKQLSVYTVMVDICPTGAEMLDRIYRQSYDLIFLDMNLADMDSLEVLSRVGQTTPPLPLVMMGGTNNARMAVEAMKRGILDFLMKDDLLTLDLAGLIQRLMDSFRLRRENAELVQINQMKDDFLATISHELRTPLTSILGLSEVLLTGRMGTLEEKQAQSLKKILEQSHLLVKLINQLLDIRALSQGGAMLAMKPISLRELAIKQATTMQTLFDKKGVQLIFENTEEPLFVQADPDSLSKVFEHLVSNALKFTPREGKVFVETKSIENGQAQFRVRDTGRGIPSEALPYVFQKFFHVDKTLTRPYGGMGLGLAFCREVVEAHSGRVWVESKGLGQGTSVTVLLPVLRDHVAAVDKKAAPAA
ncbi:MAG TPA: hybrid sensor histidine kinase/response regulator, partial [Elusimicrobiota bacterium]|nr:hybrid sensor histidine kinase/response regulator [Elusimicrobiota bacterium]